MKHGIRALVLVAVLLAGRASLGQAGATCETLNGAVSGAKGRLQGTQTEIEAIDFKLTSLQARKAELVQQRALLAADLRDAEAAARMGCATCDDALKRMEAKRAALAVAWKTAPTTQRGIHGLSREAKGVLREATNKRIEWETSGCADPAAARADVVAIAKCAKLRHDFAKIQRRVDVVAGLVAREQARSGATASDIRKRLEGVDPLIEGAVDACGETDRNGPIRQLKRDLGTVLEDLALVPSIAADVARARAEKLAEPKGPIRGK